MIYLKVRVRKDMIYLEDIQRVKTHWDIAYKTPIKLRTKFAALRGGVYTR